MKKIMMLTALGLILGLTSACGKKKSNAARVVTPAQTTVPTNFNPQTGTFNNACGTQIGANCNLGLPQGATCESLPGYFTDPNTGQCVAGGGGLPQQQIPQQYYPQTQQPGYGYGMEFVGYYQGYRVFFDSMSGNYYYTY